jgi:hypothetical protein
MTKQEFAELAKKHLVALDGYKLDKNGNTKIEIFGIEKLYEAINYTHCCTELFCLDNTDADGLTLHKRYKFINEDETNSLIIDDYGGNKAYLSNRFVKVIK